MKPIQRTSVNSLDGVPAGVDRALLSEEMEKIKSLVGEKRFAAGKYGLAKQLFDQLVTEKNFSEFLTLKAYEYLDWVTGGEL